jgi:hypothetical protein
MVDPLRFSFSSVTGRYQGCSSRFGQDKIKAAEKAPQAAVAAAYKFAEYEEVTVNATPAVKPYSVERDLGNITNKDMFQLSRRL